MENCPAWLLLPPRVPLWQQHFCFAELGNDFLGLCHVLTIIFLTPLVRDPSPTPRRPSGALHYSLLPH